MGCGSCGGGRAKMFVVQAPDGRSWVFLTRGEAVRQAAKVPGSRVIER